MNWAARHSRPDTGGVDATSRRSREASFNGADGVVENGTTSSKERIPKHFSTPNHPVCAASVASHLFLMAQAPLYQEGSSATRPKTERNGPVSQLNPSPL